MVKNLTLDKPGKLRFATRERMGFLLVMRGAGYLAEQGKLGQDTLLLCKPDQVVELLWHGGRIPLNVLWVRLTREQISSCSTEQTDLWAAFGINPSPTVLARPRSDILMLCKSLAMQLEKIPQERDIYASDVMERSTTGMFLALVLQAFVTQDPHNIKPIYSSRSQFSLDEVFRYIHTHLTEDLTLESLEKEFYISRSHLIREFKKRTGQTVHSYIVRARLDLCRSYIEQGYSITEVYRMGGFGGYNHFFKAFRNAYGMTPKEYYRLYSQESTAKKG